jgi:hypothetical protein
MHVPPTFAHIPLPPTGIVSPAAAMGGQPLDEDVVDEEDVPHATTADETTTTSIQRFMPDLFATRSPAAKTLLFGLCRSPICANQDGAPVVTAGVTS